MEPFKGLQPRLGRFSWNFKGMKISSGTPLGVARVKVRTDPGYLIKSQQSRIELVTRPDLIKDFIPVSFGFRTPFGSFGAKNFGQVEKETRQKAQAATPSAEKDTNPRPSQLPVDDTAPELAAGFIAITNFFGSLLSFLQSTQLSNL